MSIHTEALDILHDIVAGRREAWDVLFALAKTNPGALVAAVNPAHAWVAVVLGHMKSANPIAAIKELRVAFSCGLKEAKDLHDKAQAVMPDEEQASRILMAGPAV